MTARMRRPDVEPVGVAEARGGVGCIFPWQEEGFTRIELLIVVVIMMALVMLYWGRLVPGGEQRQRADCQNQLQRIHVALRLYATDSGQRYPVVARAASSEEALAVLVPRYTIDTSIFICPASRDSALPAAEPFEKRRISYAYYMGLTAEDIRTPVMSDRQVDALPKKAGDRAFSETGDPPANNHRKDGGNFLFSDGSVEFTPPRLTFAAEPGVGVVLLNPKP